MNARSEYTNNEEDGKAEHHLNQYLIKDEIGRGSFGAVHLAVDQYGKEYVSKYKSRSSSFYFTGFMADGALIGSQGVLEISITKESTV